MEPVKEAAIERSASTKESHPLDRERPTNSQPGTAQKTTA
jgi:hypothetical protein